MKSPRHILTTNTDPSSYHEHANHIQKSYIPYKGYGTRRRFKFISNISTAHAKLNTSVFLPLCPIKSIQVEQNAPLARYSTSVENEEELQVNVEMETIETRKRTKYKKSIKSDKLHRFHKNVCLRLLKQAGDLKKKKLETEKALRDEEFRLLNSFSHVAKITPKTERKDVVECSMNSSLKTIKHKVCRYVVGNLRFLFLIFSYKGEDTKLHKKRDRSIHLYTKITSSLVRLEESNQFHEFPSNENNLLLNRSEKINQEQRANLLYLVHQSFRKRDRERVRIQRNKKYVHAKRVATKQGTKNSDEFSKESDRLNVTDGSEIAIRIAICSPRKGIQNLPLSRSPVSKIKQFRQPNILYKSKKEKERFMLALQETLEIPVLCCCPQKKDNTSTREKAKYLPGVPWKTCANNCRLYQHPGEFKRLVTCVCNQGD